MVKEDDVLNKYYKIWDKIKKKLNIKYHSMPVYDETYIKAKVREFVGKIKTNVLSDGVPKENMHCICIVCVAIDSVMRMKKENYPLVYLEECKYKVKQIQMCRFINAELESVSDSYSEAESDMELIARLKSGSGYNSE